MKVHKDEIIMILILILLEAIGVGICYVWFDQLHIIWQCIITILNIIWLVLLYRCIRKLNKKLK